MPGELHGSDGNARIGARGRRGVAVAALAAIVAGMFAGVLPSSAASASDAIIVVANANADDSGPGTLRDAVNTANNHDGFDEIRFDPALDGLTITLTGGALTVSEELTVRGQDDGGNPLGITVSGNDTSRIFEATASLSVDHLTLTHGGATGDMGGAGGNGTDADALSGADGEAGDPGVDGADGQGGAIFSSAAVTATDSTFSANSATGGAGGPGGAGGTGDLSGT